MNGINDDSMIIETDSDLLCESSINSNLTIYDDFFYSIDESISSGDIYVPKVSRKNFLSCCILIKISINYFIIISFFYRFKW